MNTNPLGTGRENLITNLNDLGFGFGCTNIPVIMTYPEAFPLASADLSVCVVSAWDADDPTEGLNARVTYSIEKNVIHEQTNEAIFEIHPNTGLVRTALCCLDRETTPEYEIRVVAVDGGSLKGTATVIVRLTDVNDNSPRLTQHMWQVDVNETWGAGPPDDTSLLEITASDPDTTNYFYYRVVERSGWGWEHFGVRAEGAVGHLYARQTLDYEDDTHRRGFKFMIQVTDRGPGGWVDTRHTDTAWVSVTLRDLNDNPPVFPRVHTHITVQEDIAPGSLLVTLPAKDPDMGRKVILSSGQNSTSLNFGLRINTPSHAKMLFYVTLPLRGRTNNISITLIITPSSSSSYHCI
ncbi:putative neural-cadherin 2 [Penaeus chinensis]|uniref:putative neural-cadherin 2 n=1 Tax=Penaeus chinensis TaxID=139456 RepID=UPI001FB81833|nr:putative neural-cadherin 2 [Penaeus chinensis]